MLFSPGGELFIRPVFKTLVRERGLLAQFVSVKGGMANFEASILNSKQMTAT